MINISFDEFDAVIFDLDGSLVDSMWMWKAIDQEYLKGFGIEPPKTLQKDIGGRSFYETAQYFKDRFGIEDTIEKIGDDWNKMAWDKYTNEVPLKDGAMSFLKKCHEKGKKLGIASSNSRELIEQVLSSHGIREYFTSIKSGSEITNGKPAPDVYLAVSDELGTQPDRCIVFEDLVDGIIAGKNAGMKVFAVEDDYSKHSEKEKRELSDDYICDYSQIVLS